jgi:integrase
MKIKSKVFKRKTGKSKGKWIARVEYFDEVDGRAKYIEHTFAKRTDAVDDRNLEVSRIQATHGQIQTGDKMKFDELAQLYSDRFYGPAIIKDGRKVAGVRSHKTVKGHLKMLRAFFGPRLIRHITPESLIDYRLWRLEQGSQRGKEKGSESISISTVNRELSSLRTIMTFASDKGWLIRPPSFKKIIDTDAERARDRLLTPDEEERLLAACQGERLIPYTRTRNGREESITAKHSVDNPQLKAILLLAIDGGLRRGEILKLRWQDFDFENYRVSIVATNTKTQRARFAPLSERVIEELFRIRPLVRGDRPFPFNNFSGAFETAKKLAGISDLRFHDLRRSAITRWIAAGVPLTFAGKLAGHAAGSAVTSKHYIATDAEMVSEIARNMNAARSTATVETENDLLN